MIETEVTTQYNISVKSIKCFGEWLSLWLLGIGQKQQL
jgi:hypothetical protein